MPLKYLRLGFTETTLLFIYFIETCHESLIKEDIIILKNNMIKWFYTTSGYYDKTITSNYMDAKHNTKYDPVIYKQYFNELLQFIKHSDIFSYGVHYDKNSAEFNLFFKYLNIKSTCLNKSIFFEFAKNKSILIISPFSELFKEQYVSNKCGTINSEFNQITDIQFYTNIYTFFNDGPHNNILETIDYIYNDILHRIPNTYDSVVISCGAYSNILGKRFYDNDKNVLTIGGELSLFFGILNNRSKKGTDLSKIDKTLWITEIPNKYKPPNYMLIENGCYW